MAALREGRAGADLVRKELPKFLVGEHDFVDRVAAVFERDVVAVYVGGEEYFW